MMRSLALLLSFLQVAVHATQYLDHNLAYRSPFFGDAKLSHDTRSIQRRGVVHVRRQMGSAAGFTDDHYPTFYGGDFSNSPFIWSGGLNFTHSVASGDPLDTSVLLWTRAVPMSAGGLAMPDQSVPACLAYKVFSDQGTDGSPVASGQAFTSYDVDWTVKVEAKGLQPDTTYVYRFSDCANPNSVSPTGSTRTLPSPDTPADQVNGGNPLTLAVFSCSQYQSGYFNAYGVAARNTSADIYIHLGDYIYEYFGNGTAIGRVTDGRELATIHDYRQRLNQYRTDESLVYAHQSGPWITDDHEVADNAWKAGSADSNDTAAGCSFSPSGACFTDRKLAAVRAYHEWMPIRQVAADDKFRIWRNFQVGKLMDLTMLDTRQYDRDITDVYYNTEFVNTISSEPNRSLMGAAQESWFYDTLSESKNRGAIWHVVGQQIVFTQLNESGSFDLDAWDGYRANRKRVLDHLYENEISNTVILAGDSHANWVSDLAHANDSTTYNPDTGEGAIGVEFGGTAVTSEGWGTSMSPGAADAISQKLVDSNTNLNLQWSEGHYRGFFTISVNSRHVNATFYAMKNHTIPNAENFVIAQFIVEAGANKLSRPVAGGASNIKGGALKLNGVQN